MVTLKSGWERRRRRVSYLLVFNAQLTGTVISKVMKKTKAEEETKEKKQ